MELNDCYSIKMKLLPPHSTRNYCDDRDWYADDVDDDDAMFANDEDSLDYGQMQRRLRMLLRLMMRSL